MDQLHLLVRNFRNAIERIPQAKFHTSLGCASFPSACCDDASQLLAAYLHDNNFGQAVRMDGTNGGFNRELNSHVWLVCAGLIIDITADQFERYGMPPVFIGASSEFHDLFDVDNQEQEVADFRVRFANDARWKGLFGNDYELILCEIDRGGL